MVLPQYSQPVAVRGAAECESTCLNNCSCTTYAYDSSGCSIWVLDLLNLQQLPQDGEGDWSKAGEGSLAAFGYKDLQNATKNFSEKLGGGGFGSVFKGTLPDSTVTAVKRLESISQGAKQFRTEVSTIGAVQHVNLVRLRGFCSEGDIKLLVYDYMPNG
ncbi:unnamed protein product [Ilex paraguariensis]|uniref:non-specific serine/threonine protein kinase n=1 Tax=Ilex paraguariensis TaxID=185542 RepID=A0ABC8RVQ6_9AQUA